MRGLIEFVAGLVKLLARWYYGVSSEPPWLTEARREIGFREVGVNRGIDGYIRLARCGQLGDPWCAIFVNAMLEKAGVRGSRSALARSFEHDPNFVKLAGPTLGAITTMWRGSTTSGLGHVFFYTGESRDNDVWGIAGNEDDGVIEAVHPRYRVVGYFWPALYPLPETGLVKRVGQSTLSSKEV